MTKYYYVYIIESSEDRRYIGITENLDQRLKQHNLGLSKWTSRYKDWKVIHQEKLNNLTEARKRENYLKKLKGGKQLYLIINKNKN